MKKKSYSILLLTGMFLLTLLIGCQPSINPKGSGNPTDQNVKVSAITLPVSVTIFEGKTRSINSTVLPSNAADKTLTWESLHPDIATVNAASGLVTGVSAGTAVIKATAADGSRISQTTSVQINAWDPTQVVNIIDSEGWLESAYVTWQGIPEADSYNVYYRGMGSADYTKIDTQLVREYPDYFRADILGLAAGSYDIKIHAVAGNDELAGAETSVNVEAHDRSGFAHSSASPKGTASGAYNDDGTLRDNAEVIYVTAGNARNLDIYTNNLKPREKTKNDSGRPLVIRFIGTIKEADMPNLNSNKLLQLKGNNAQYEQRVTFEGVGDDAYLEFGLDIVRSSNVEIRNLGFKKFYEDAVSVQSNNTNIWVHNCDFFYGQNGGGDKKKGDGASDIKDSQWCTLSYNHYWDSGKASLLGNGANDTIDYITYHHNFFDHSDSRHPRVRLGRVHVYNNYYEGVAKYGIGSVRGASVFAEGNYYHNTKRPMLISMQGSDIVGDPDGSFDDGIGGMIKAFNNYMDNYSADSFDPWSNSDQVEFDAYQVSSRNDTVPASVITKVGSHTYNNFDTASSMYIYTPDSPEDAKTKVIQYAGRMFGGDMKYEFKPNDYTKADDPDPAIAAMINAHASKVISVQGENVPGDGGDPGDGGEPGDGGGDGPPNNSTYWIPERDGGNGTPSWLTYGGGFGLKDKVASFTYNGISITKPVKFQSSNSGNVKVTTTGDNAVLNIWLINGKKFTIVGPDSFSELITTGQTVPTKISIPLGKAGEYTFTKRDDETCFYVFELQ